jgi:amidase
MQAKDEDLITRRRFMAATAASGAALLVGRFGELQGLASAGAAAAHAPTAYDDAPWIEATFRDLQRLMARGDLSSRQLTRAYLNRIERFNPLLHAVIETNPDALAIADRRDAERKQGQVRSQLHGIPILLKDNIATDDRMETTAGSLALVGARVAEDSAVAQRLRNAGAVILGKTNLSEWANFRGSPPPDFPFETNFLNGWSARGGFTLDPYLLSFDPCGSSSGSAAAPAANLAAAAIGTETDGSIVCPSGNNLIVGLKPTVGLIPGRGIIPIAHSQDSAGPMTRTVEDAAVLLNVLHRSVVEGQRTPAHYGEFLRKDALRGARIGIERRLFEPPLFFPPPDLGIIEDAIAAMGEAGARIIDPVDTGDPSNWFDAEFTVLLYEFKHDIEQYLEGLSHTSMRTLGDLIQFNIDHCGREMKYFGQEIFELAEETGGNLSDPVYLDARQTALRFARDQGIDRVMRQHNLDAVLTPSYSAGSSAPAVSGYPIIAVPVGFDKDGRPAGVELTAGFLQEPQLLALAYAIEQLLQPRSAPRFRGDPPPPPPNAGICGAPMLASMRREGGIDRGRFMATHWRGHMFPGR